MTPHIFLNHPAAKLVPGEAAACSMLLITTLIEHPLYSRHCLHKLYVYHVNLSSVLAILYPVCNHQLNLTDEETENLGDQAQGHTAQQGYESKQDTLALPSTDAQN